MTIAAASGYLTMSRRAKDALTLDARLVPAKPCGQSVKITKHTTPEQIARMLEGWTCKLEKDDRGGSATTVES